MFSLNLIIAGILTAIGVMLIFAKFKRTWLYRMLGYDYIVDIIFTFGFMIFMAGTYSGAMVAIINGICISIVLWVTKNIIGYQKLELIDNYEEPVDIFNYNWVYYSGTWTMESAGTFVRKGIAKLSVHIYNFIKGWVKR